MIMSIVTTALAGAATVLSMFTERIKGPIIGILFVVSFVIGVAAMSIFTKDTTIADKFYGWSYICGWGGSIIDLVTGVAAYLMIK